MGKKMLHVILGCVLSGTALVGIAALIWTYRTADIEYSKIISQVNTTNISVEVFQNKVSSLAEQAEAIDNAVNVLATNLSDYENDLLTPGIAPDYEKYYLMVDKETTKAGPRWTVYYDRAIADCSWRFLPTYPVSLDTIPLSWALEDSFGNLLAVAFGNYDVSSGKLRNLRVEELRSSIYSIASPDDNSPAGD